MQGVAGALVVPACPVSCAGWGMNQQRKRPFEALEVAVRAVRVLRSAVETIGHKDRALEQQLRKALSSVPMNLGEGRRRSGRDRLHLYRVSAGSADEVCIALRVAEAMGYVELEDVAEGLELLDRVLAMTWRLTH